eukprot:1750259-Prymnesium_polylepis.1
MSPDGEPISFSHDDWVRAVAFSSDDTLLATAGDDGVLQLGDALTGEVKWSTESIGSNSYLFTAAFSPG